MSDIFCRKCGEPWDRYGVYHHTDMLPEESKRFLRGEGCPSCNWGKQCPDCYGKGKVRDYWNEEKTCSRCNGSGELVIENEAEGKFYLSALESTDDPDSLLDLWGV